MTTTTMLDFTLSDGWEAEEKGRRYYGKHLYQIISIEKEVAADSFLWQITGVNSSDEDTETWNNKAWYSRHVEHHSLDGLGSQKYWLENRTEQQTN